MRASIAVEQAMPVVDRLAMALIELTAAAAVIVGAIVVGHELREWREWYPTAYHPWLERAQPPAEVAEP